MSALTLVLPAILDAPRDALVALSAQATALRRVVSNPTSATAQSSGFWDCVAELLGIAAQQDVPLAPIWARADGLDVGNAYWMRASPVTLEAGRDDVRLVDASPTLSDAEAAALLAMLNAHFAADGLSFVAPVSGRWYVRAATTPALHTTPPIDALGRSLRPLLARGADAPKWRRWQNEMQMLLFEHAVNTQRERQHIAAINSVWWWAGGTLPETPRATVSQVFSDDPEAAQLGEFVHASVLPLSDLEGQRATHGSGPTLVIAPSTERDPRAAIQLAQETALGFLERRVDTLTLILVGRGRSVRLLGRRPGLWRRMTGEPPLDLAAALAQWPQPEDAK